LGNLLPRKEAAAAHRLLLPETWRIFRKCLKLSAQSRKLSNLLTVAKRPGSREALPRNIQSAVRIGPPAYCFAMESLSIFHIVTGATQSWVLALDECGVAKSRLNGK
jgi:hypothetical protein